MCRQKSNGGHSVLLSLSVPDDLTPVPMELRHFLRRRAGISLSHWRKIKNQGKIFINDRPAHPCDAVIPKDIITIQMPISTRLPPNSTPIDCRYEDEWLLVINKPAGLLMHPTTAERSDTLANRVLYYYQSTQQALDFHPVHRLDRQTSGLVLIAKSPHIQHAFSCASVKLRRRYLAIVHGVLSPLAGRIALPIARSPGSIITREVNSHGQSAVTDYRTLAHTADYSLLEIELQTGRTHQIRVHFSHLGHALLGDSLYGLASPLLSRQALHAYALSFPHPVTGRHIEFQQPLPNDLQSALAAISLSQII